MRPVSPIAPYPSLLFNVCTLFENWSYGYYRIHPSASEGSESSPESGNVIEGVGVRGGELPQHTGIVGVITMGYMIRRIGLFVNAITRSTSALCSNSMATVCAWYLTAGLSSNLSIMQKLSTSGEVSQYDAPNERGDNLHPHFWDKISYTCSFRGKKRRNEEGTNKHSSK